MKILIVDDHPLIRDALSLCVLHIHPEATVDVADSIDQALSLTAAKEYGLCLLDLGLPDNLDLLGLSRLREQANTLPIVVVSATADTQTVHHALYQGAMGFIPKTATQSVIMAAIKHVLKGGIFVPPNLSETYQTRVQSQLAPSLSLAQFIEDYDLTGKQSEVLVLLIRGMANKVIGRELGLAESTVKSHVTAILNKLNVENRTQVVYKANQLGLVLPIKI